MTLQRFAQSTMQPISNWQWFWENFAGSVTGLVTATAAITAAILTIRAGRHGRMQERVRNRYDMLQQKYSEVAEMCHDAMFNLLIISGLDKEFANVNDDEGVEWIESQQAKYYQKKEIAVCDAIRAAAALRFLDSDQDRIAKLSKLIFKLSDLEKKEEGIERKLKECFSELADSLDASYRHEFHLASKGQYPDRLITIRTPPPQKAPVRPTPSAAPEPVPSPSNASQ